MIEMRWQKIDQTNESDDARLKNSTFVGNAQCVLQFREVHTAGDRFFETNWQDVEIAKEGKQA